MYIGTKHSKAVYYRVGAKVLKKFCEEAKERWEEGSKLAKIIII